MYQKNTVEPITAFTLYSESKTYLTHVDKLIEMFR